MKNFAHGIFILPFLAIGNAHAFSINPTDDLDEILNSFGFLNHENITVIFAELIYGAGNGVK